MSKEKALDLFNKGGFNCAQSVCAAFCEKYGFDEKAALQFSGAAGGGFRCGEVCGAAAGALFVVGLKYGQTIPQDIETKNICNEKAVEFVSLFKQRNTSIVCREILNCDTSTPEGKKYAQEHNLHARVCAPLIENTVQLLEELQY